MDDLRATLATLSPDDQREFGHFMQRQSPNRPDRLDSRLYELLRRPKAYSPEQLIAKLYPDTPNPAAYYALRKRLLRQLADYLVLRQRQHDPTAAATVRGQLTLAQYLLDAGVPRLAWGLLRKAEKLALANEQYEPLNAVYNLQIQFADSPHAPPLEDIIRRRHLNKKAADEEERAGIADSLLRLRLREARTKGRAAVPFDAIMQDILKEYDLREAFARSPSLLCRLMSIARSAMLVRRDFVSFAPFIERCYRLMERRHGFAPAQQGYQLRLLYMLAHALYRARRFADSVTYLKQGRQLLAAAPGRAAAGLGPRFTFLLAANYAFLRRNADSINLLEQALRARPPLSEADELTARLQLAFHQFAENQFAKANQSLIQLDRTDYWLEQHLGLEWLLKKTMGEILIQFELGNAEHALGRLHYLKQLLTERFPAQEATADGLPAAPAGGAYRYVLDYLRLVREILENPAVAAQAAFRQRLRQMPALPPVESEDLQSQSFFAWLRARSEGRPYYQVLLEVAGS
ncbi:hypothetical protein [uncultured Hymenobacter sp.]|uniref:hypothetical protein n=1 Tax=uncultured Hymenobacter sp. TaxID=170016 RepID=UPI0035CBDDBF